MLRWTDLRNQKSGGHSLLRVHERTKIRRTGESENKAMKTKTDHKRERIPRRFGIEQVIISAITELQPIECRERNWRGAPPL